MQGHQLFNGAPQQISHPGSGQVFFPPSLGTFVPSANSALPEVIGEGEITSVTFPDGTVQFYFLPITTKRGTPYALNENVYYNPYWRPNTGVVWYIRNPMPQVTCNQYWQKTNLGLNPKPCVNSECNLTPQQGFQLKFHNDGWTSTTDLHYFWPSRSRKVDYTIIPSKHSTSTQVDISLQTKSVGQNEDVYTKPRNTPWCEEKKQTCKCLYKDVEKECSKMSISDSKTSRHDGRKFKKIRNLSKSTCCTSLHAKKPKSKLSQNRIVSECPSTTDKVVTTYTDQGSSCVCEKGGQTQSDQHATTVSLRRVNSAIHVANATTLWNPKTQLAQRAMETQSSEKIIGVYDTECECTDHDDCSDTDSE